MPCVRAVAIINERPRPASQADIVSIITGNIIGEEDENFKAHRLNPIKIANIMLSKQSRADSRWMRLNDRPIRPRKNEAVRSHGSLFSIIKSGYGVKP